jgi:ABC-type sugar transport system permease subunit
MKQSIQRKDTISWIGKDSTQAVLMIFPMLIGFFIFTYCPILYILRYSTFDYNGFAKATFTGANNFIRVFQRDPAYWDSFLNTLVLSGGKLLIEIPLALLLAILLQKQGGVAGFFRVTLFLPTIISTAIVGLIFSLMFGATQGVINMMLVKIGVISGPVDWLGAKWTALMMIGIASIWAYVGINMIFFLMALQGVPKELYECATLDGCTGLKRFVRITLPMIGPIFRVVLLNAIIGSLKVTDLVLSSTNGQPGGKTEVVMTYVFKYFTGMSGRRIDVGYASAMSLLTGLFLAAMSFFYLKASKKMNLED